MIIENWLRAGRVLLPALVAAFLSGCGRSPERAENTIQGPAGGVLLRGAGATFPSLLYKKWFADYHAAHPDVAITYDAVGSGEGVRRFIGTAVKDDERVDFAASDAAMTD